MLTWLHQISGFWKEEVWTRVRTGSRYAKQFAHTVKTPEFSSLVEKNDWWLFVVYKITLTLMYAFLQYPLFGYSGYDLVLNVWRMLFGWVIYFGLVAVLKKYRRDDVSATFMYVLVMMSVTPFIIFYEMSPSCSLWMVMIQALCTLFIAILFYLKIPIPVRFTGISYKNKYLRIGTLVILAGYFVYLTVRFGLPGVEALSFHDIHQVRAEVELQAWESILQNVMCKAVCPLLLIVTLKEKKWFAVAGVLLLQVYTYSVTGFKTYLFIPVIVMGMQLLPVLSTKKTIQVLLTCGVILLILGYGLTQSSMLYALIGDRMLFMPARIKYAYFDYFSQHEFINFSQNSFSSFLGLTGIYTSPVQYMIGDLYFNKPEMWTNTGFMADAYANLGIPGMLLMSGMLCAVLIVLRESLRGATPSLQKGLQSLYVIFFIALNDGPVISELFSGGMLISVMLVLMINFDESKKKWGFSFGKHIDE